MISLFPIRTEINNGILTANRAMPLKNITSDNTSTFSVDRHNYIESSTNTTTIKQNGQKKWIGGNRDASNVISRRRVNSVGNGTLNASGKPISFNTVSDTNTERQAYHRVRSGGSAVPAKCTHKYVNAPIFH
jgi:hypothetical protein